MFKTTISISCALLALVFLSGCANREDTDSNSVIRKQENDHQINGEAGAYYGRSG